MSERSFRCGNCGADVGFSSPGTLVVVCDHCHWSSYRTDVDLEQIGQVAQPAPIASWFQIGTQGRLLGVPFTVRGQLQLDHGAGLWNEWAAEDADGQWLWLAEAQGEVQVYREVEPPDGKSVAERGQLSPGRKVRVFKGDWVVNEVGEGRVVAAAGEHPVELRVGERTSYADLQSGEHGVLTLDFTRPGPPEALVGQRLELEDLELDPSTMPEHRPETVTSRRIDCANCGGGIELVDPEHALHIGCPSCGTLLEQDSDQVRAIGTAAEIRKKPDIPLGARGELGGEAVQVIGLMQRRVQAEGVWWPWREYLLRTPRGAYRWLVEDSGHWLYVRPVPYSTALAGRYRGQRFKHFTSGEAEVHWVLGEFYWQVRAGDRVRTRDYTAPPRSLSIESNPLEISASLGQYLEPEAVAAAFDEPVDLPRRHGVGMAQPNRARPGSDWKLYALLVAALIALRVFFGATHRNELVLAAEFGPTPADQDAEPNVQFTDPFELPAALGNVQVRVEVPGLDQGWLGLDGALVDLDSGEVRTFAVSAQRYSGVSDGESWSEGNRRGGTLVGSVPGGTYRLRLAASGWDAGVNRVYRVMVRNQVAGVLWLMLALLLPLVLPIIATLRWFSFEHRRWSNSDHPWGEE